MATNKGAMTMKLNHNLVSSYSRRRFACLFVSLIVTMVAAPVLGAMGFSTRFVEVLLAFNILAAILITVFSLGTYIGLGFLALVLAARGAYALLGYESLLATSQGVGALICLVSACIMFHFILSEGPVTSERIFAALDVYLMLGIMCGLLFCIFEEQWPGSFSFQTTSHATSNRSLLAHTIYFSFVTLGTLGYGDITPVGGPARALAVTEAICGQIYLVVVVARLVSLYKGRSEPSELDERDETTPADRNPQA
jgi:hypothetical protein